MPEHKFRVKMKRTKPDQPTYTIQLNPYISELPENHSELLMSSEPCCPYAD